MCGIDDRAAVRTRPRQAVCRKAANCTYVTPLGCRLRVRRSARGTPVALSWVVARSTQNAKIAFGTHHARQGRAEETNMMLSLITRLQSIGRREEGQDLLEYALLVALIALVAVGAITLAGKNVNTIFGQIATALTPSA
jgi:pilus assembly protein Flp/PilA